MEEAAGFLPSGDAEGETESCLKGLNEGIPTVEVQVKSEVVHPVMPRRTGKEIRKEKRLQNEPLNFIGA